MSISRKPKPCGCNRLCECHKPPHERSTLRRGAPPKRKGRVNPVSKKRQKENRERTAAKRRLFAKHPRCQRCHVRPSEHAHEVKTRARGGSITDLANMRALCFDCHRWIHHNINAATAEGWLANSWEK